MRLVCPNCDATYEVPDSVIPDEGRDVQCSNCGSAWFFDPNPAPEPEPEPDLEPSLEQAPAAAPERPAPAPEETTVYEADGQDEEAEPVSRPSRRPLEASVKNVLREEAEFEARARAEDAGLEYQEDLPLDTPQDAPHPEPDAEALAAVAGSRRDLLPDIDEINSTLRSTNDRGRVAPAAAVEVDTNARSHRRGFRLGFGLVISILAIAAVVYSSAGAIAEAVPQLAGVLDSYVTAVNGLRLWLQETVAGFGGSGDGG